MHGSTPSPNPTPQLDPSLRQLLLDTDLSLIKSREYREQNKSAASPGCFTTPGPSKEDAETKDYYTLDAIEENDAEAWHNRSEKRSQEAVFGSKRIGSISIPFELEHNMEAIISANDKHQLRSDAKRLFMCANEFGTNNTAEKRDYWTPQLPDKFKGPKKFKASRITPREALAFSVIALPGQFSAISNVLEEARTRLGEHWSENVKTIIDFGSGAGAGIWSSLTIFRKKAELASDQVEPVSDDGRLSGGPLALSTIQHYLCLENRPGLLSVSKRLTTGLSMGHTRLQVEKYWGQDGHQIYSSFGEAIAIMAFTLSELPTHVSRTKMLREMWNTGAETMIIIDHGTDEGFKIVANARQYLLSKGRRNISLTEDSSVSEADQVAGSHVVAPCPHDGTCPLTLHSVNKSFPTICSFSQRLSRPAFLRRTKHATKGHEDIQYSYVIVRRGPRPPAPPRTWDSAIRSAHSPEKRLRKRVLVEDLDATTSGDQPVPSGILDEVTLKWQQTFESDQNVRKRERSHFANAHPRLEEIRAESYYWPRIICPPLKRSGHIILDTCTKEGHIARHTIPKSQGKQPYYDARKAKWGDSFPWESKNGPDIRRKGKQLAVENDSPEDEEEGDLSDLVGDWDVAFDGKGEMFLTSSRPTRGKRS